MTGKILIVDDVATNRIVLKVKLAAACYQPLLAASGAAALALARRELPDLILLDHALQDMSGIDLLRHLRVDPATRDIPVVMLAADGSTDQRLQALRAGVDDFLQKPVDDQMLMARLRNLVRSRDATAEVEARDPAHQVPGMAEPAAVFEVAGLVALVSDCPTEAMALRRELCTALADTLVILTPEEALSEPAPGSIPPDVFVLAADLGGRNLGLRLMSELLSRPQTRHAALCIILPDAAPEGAAMAFDLGAHDVVRPDANPQELALRLSRMLRRKRAADQIRATVQDGLRLSVIDPLTGLFNRRYALPCLGGIAERSGAAGLPYAVMIIDIDRFKTVNDRFGHAAGDAVLIEVSRRLLENLRAGDLLARIGGEEFLIGLPGTALAEAKVIADRLCAQINARPIRTSDRAGIPVTASIGLAIGPVRTGGETVAEIIDRADHALLVAKSGGRNQVTICRSAA
jgi:two-component system, cell cycle response regulator